MYTPKPIDTSDIQLSDDLLVLSELIAEHVHEVWAASRIAEGWVYGKNRDDCAKTTPCLVPYSSLPEHEKEYDRHTAMQTLRLVKKLGYQISKK